MMAGTLGNMASNIQNATQTTTRRSQAPVRGWAANQRRGASEPSSAAKKTLRPGLGTAVTVTSRVHAIARRALAVFVFVFMCGRGSRRSAEDRKCKVSADSWRCVIVLRYRAAAGGGDRGTDGYRKTELSRKWVAKRGCMSCRGDVKGGEDTLKPCEQPA